MPARNGTGIAHQFAKAGRKRHARFHIEAASSATRRWHAPVVAERFRHQLDVVADRGAWPVVPLPSRSLSRIPCGPGCGTIPLHSLDIPMTSPQPPLERDAAIPNEPTSVTAVLNAAGSGREGLDQVFGLVYAELKRIASRVLARSAPSTLNPTALVHEVYAKLIGSEQLDLQGRQHFYSLCARTMRQIVVDHARSRCAGKRGGGEAFVTLTDDGAIDVSQPETLVALDAALDRLEERDPRLVELLHYRVFAGMELAEIAPLFGVTVRQLQRDWQRARIWIADALLGDGDG
jgi:RNA polymerase sigma factor (TIGR02999 family)